MIGTCDNTYIIAVNSVGKGNDKVRKPLITQKWISPTSRLLQNTIILLNAILSFLLSIVNQKKNK